MDGSHAYQPCSVYIISAPLAVKSASQNIRQATVKYLQSAVAANTHS